MPAIAPRRRPQARPTQAAHFDARLSAEASAMLKELRRLGLKPSLPSGPALTATPPPKKSWKR